MADKEYKKGELLFDDTLTVRDEYGRTVDISTFLAQEVLIINFDGADYECEKNVTEWGNMYGGFSLEGPEFSVYPFLIHCNEVVLPDNNFPTSQITLYAQNYGTYALKIYTAVEGEEDSQSESEVNFIREYIDKNLLNLNWNILPQIFEENGVELTEEIKTYLKKTPGNTNWNVFKSLGSGREGGIILFENDCEFSAPPAPVNWVRYMNNSIPKEQIFDNLIDGDEIKVSIGTNEFIGAIVEKESGYTTTKEFILDNPLIDNCNISWDNYGQSPYTTLTIAAYIEIGTYHLKIEKYN